MSEAESHSRTTPARAAGGWCVAAGFAVYAVVLALHMGAFGGASDPSGYLNSAAGFQHGTVLVERRVLAGAPAADLSDWVYVPVGFVGAGPNAMAPAYPCGLPLLVAGISWLSGWNLAPHLTLWLHALVGVMMMFLLARQAGLRPALAVLGAAVLAGSPLYLHLSVQLMSDVPALVWTALAVFFAGQGRTRKVCSLYAGLAFGVAVLIRPTNVLALPAVLMATGLNLNRLALLGLGGLPEAVILGAYNRVAYGSVLTSGYGDLSLSIGLGNIPDVVGNYLQWMPVFLTPGIVGAAWCLRRIDWRVAVNAIWSGAYLAFYACYRFAGDDHWSLRFLLPAFPPLLLLALGAMDRVLEKQVAARGARRRSVAIAVTAVLMGLWLLGWNLHLGPFNVRRAHRDYVQVADWANGNLPANAVVVAMQMSGALYQYTPFTLVRWDQLNGRDVEVIVRAAAKEGRPIFALLYEYEREPALNERMPGDWTKIAAVRQTTIWRRAANLEE